MYDITINEKSIKVTKGTTILEAALQNNIYIPTLCYNHNLHPYGACRLCLVEISTAFRKDDKKVVTSCTYPCEQNLIVITDSAKIKRARKVMIGLILARAKNSKTVENIAQEYGVMDKTNDKTALYLYKRAKNSRQSECILCGLCERVCSEVTERHAISFVNRGNKKKIKSPFDKNSESCIGCGLCAYICPTNAINVKEL